VSPHRCRFHVTAVIAFLAVLVGALLVMHGQAVAQPSGWTLTKTPNPTTYTAAGQIINYTYVITNSTGSNGTLFSLTDDRVTTINCPTNNVPPNGTLTCTGSYTITAADVIAGSVTNHAIATGDRCNDGCNVSAQAQATVNFVAQPSWTLTKTPNPTTYTAAGQVVAYSYLLTNTGNVAINAISINDNKVAPVSCPANSLAPGANMTCTGNYTTTAADVTNGSVVNTATATGTPAAGALQPVTAQATITFRLPPTGSITIIKTATGGNESFNFTSSVPAAGSFALVTAGGTAQRTFTNLTPATYTFTEVNLPLSWKLTALSCTGDTGGVPTTVNLSNRSVSIGLDGGEAITCTFTNFFDADAHRQQTQAVIQRFLSHRVQLLSDNEPDRNRFVRRFQGSLWGDDDQTRGGSDGPFSFSGNSTALSSQLAFSTSLSRIAQAHADVDAKNESFMAYARAGKPPRPRVVAQDNGLDVWVEAHFSQFKADDLGVSNRGHFGVIYLGADYLLTPSLLVGALVQYDWMGEQSRTLSTAVDGQGAMAGPYMTVRLAPNVFFDARAAWGTSDNVVNPFGLFEDKFTTSRWLARANLTGNWRFGDIRVTPSAGVTFVEEKQLSYVDRLGVLIPSQTVSLGRFDAGPEIAYRIVADSGATFEPHVALKGIWDFRKPDSTNSVAGLVVSGDEFHAKVQTGLLARIPNGWSIRTVVSYDGVGSRNFHNVSGQLWMNFPLH
jgi:Autotransporter beta-domain